MSMDGAHTSAIHASRQQRMVSLASEMARRKMEALRIYRPMPTQMPFYESEAMIRIVRGGNRGGKSQAAFSEFASAATGMPIIGPDNKPLPYRYPKPPLKLWVIGYDEKHIGQTIFRMLFQAQAFRMIRDKETKEWRSWRPWEPEDEARRKETRFAPPLIPPRMIDKKGWAWENRAERVFRVCRLLNGNEIYAFSSKGEPKQGDSVDLILIDEDVAHPQHVPEYIARITDREGRLIWSAMPHERNDALVQLCDQAALQRDDAKPNVSEIVLRMSANPYLPKEHTQKVISLFSDEERRRRDLGEFNKEATLVFPGFSAATHGIDLATWESRYQGGKNWCRYLVVDPGWQRLAVSFWAVSPPEVQPEMIVLEEELYLQHADAAELARHVRQKVGQKVYESFIIDLHGSRITESGSGRTVVEQYSEAFRAAGISSVRTRHHFEPGSDDRKGRIEAFRSWLRLQSNGRPKCFVVRDTTPNFQMEISRYRWKKVRDIVIDEPDDRHFSHLMVTAQYFAAAMETVGRAKWRKPPPYILRNKSAADMALEAKRRRKFEHRSDYVNLGPEETAQQYQFL